MEVIKKIFDRLIKLGEWLRELNFVKKVIQIKSVLQEQIILRKMIFFSVLFGSWLILVVAGLTSSNRQVYSEDELSTEQNFANGTGSVKLASQTYSKKDRLILLDFELNGQAGSGINPRNLKWKLYSKKARNSKLEVVPIYDKKVMVMIKNVPEDFDAYAVQITNKSVNANDISIDISSSSSSGTVTKKSSKKDWLQFMVTSRGKNLKQKDLKNISRKDLVLSEVNREIKFQNGQIKKLETAVKDMNKLIKDNNDKIKSLQKNATYLTDDQKESNDTEISNLRSSNDNYYQQIDEAKKNIKIVQARVKMLHKKYNDIKNGKLTNYTTVDVD
ncbi:hypothetical protein [Ligilactobacillus salivarius]|uniref:Uncharacterized protein n=1 Tax=Ligilactobacillus salivarius TaxID=1624 RepID=A0A089QKN8_9LACO|nr:hypothetical protein [Ligilactobacillus salivarius]AIR11511.1 hypothetical protein LSJ_2098 [Ligilactobacillus salivarius]MDH4960352.1 hypothetical protein [Ligilactobacillus salivarius]UUY24347.1 hypothetical protein NUU06_10150 [Ligilactobacillus salivarius]UXI83620.1 hypothetical protein NYZ94_02590 [Ligilactobacillus salivarius]UXI83888.1 hypothetical protein NYZ94_01365 [Ligilactobacillus salivarius]